MKKPTVSQLKKKLDKEFSVYVRQRDSDEDGYGNCITCYKKMHWKQAHAGHFMSRRYMATRWDEENVNLQGACCNTFGGGRQYEHGLEIDKKYGDGTAEKLHKQSKQITKFKPYELQEMLDYYKQANRS